MSRARRALGVMCLVAGGALVAHALYIPAKAALAHVLIARAFAHEQETGQTTAPWPGADLSVHAKMRVPRLDVERFVLEGSSLRTMAFGPGHTMRTPAIGADGTAVVGGHRDTHMHFLGEVVLGDVFLFEDRHGVEHTYHVIAQEVVDRRQVSAVRSVPGRHRVALVTCFPLDKPTPGGDERLVVLLEEDVAGSAVAMR